MKGGADRKVYPLRVDTALWSAVERCAAAELRSVNAQVECLLARGAERARRQAEALGPAKARAPAEGGKMSDDGPEWFAPKRYGYGSGLPIAWQGWAVMAALSLMVAAACRIRFSAERPLTSLRSWSRRPSSYW